MGKPNFSDEFKRDAVAQITERGYPVAEVSERLGVSQHSLYAWKRQLAKVVSGDDGKDAEIRLRGRTGSLIKIIWHDGIGMSLYSKLLEKGRFVWPSAKDGIVSLTNAQLSCLLEGIDWRNPQYSWRPQSAG